VVWLAVKVHDQGHGETDDIMAVIEYARAKHAGLTFMPVVLVSVLMY
jgi:alpha/beta superfamily hydrolase